MRSVICSRRGRVEAQGSQSCFSSWRFSGEEPGEVQSLLCTSQPEGNEVTGVWSLGVLLVLATPSADLTSVPLKVVVWFLMHIYCCQTRLSQLGSETSFWKE